MHSAFRRIAVVGPGLIGGSILLALAERWPDVERIAIDRDDDLSRVSSADLIVLSAPVSENLILLERLRSVGSPSTVITDTGSTKATVVACSRGLRFVGGHPIAGAAASGREAARADLFAGRSWVLTPGGETADDDLGRLRAFVGGLGATPVVMEAAEHDRLFAYLSHLPQIVTSALMDVVGIHARADGLTLAGPGLRDSTRLASSPPVIWRDIIDTNRQNIVAALNALDAYLQHLRRAISDGKDVTSTFEAAARWKKILDGD